MEACGRECLGQRVARAEHAVAVGLLDGQSAKGSLTDRKRERVGGALQAEVVVGP